MLCAVKAAAPFRPRAAGSEMSTESAMFTHTAPDPGALRIQMGTYSQGAGHAGRLGPVILMPTQEAGIFAMLLASPLPGTW